MYLVIFIKEKYVNGKILKEVKEFDTLKMAVAYLMKLDSLTEAKVARVVEDFEVIEK